MSTIPQIGDPHPEGPSSFGNPQSAISDQQCPSDARALDLQALADTAREIKRQIADTQARLTRLKGDLRKTERQIVDCAMDPNARLFQFVTAPEPPRNGDVPVSETSMQPAPAPAPAAEERMLLTLQMQGEEERRVLIIQNGQNGCEGAPPAANPRTVSLPVIQPAPPDKPVLTPRDATYEEFSENRFVPETAARVIHRLAPQPPGALVVTDHDILNNVTAFVVAWGRIDTVKPGSLDEDKAPFNADGYRTLCAAARVLRAHHGIADPDDGPEAPEHEVGYDGGLAVEIEPGQIYTAKDLRVHPDWLHQCVTKNQIFPDPPKFEGSGGTIDSVTNIDGRPYTVTGGSVRDGVVRFRLSECVPIDSWDDKVLTWKQAFDALDGAPEEAELRGVRVVDHADEEWVLAANDEAIFCEVPRDQLPKEDVAYRPPAAAQDDTGPALSEAEGNEDRIYPEDRADDEEFARRWYAKWAASDSPELNQERLRTILELPTWCRHLMLDAKLNDFGVCPKPERKRIHTIPKTLGTVDVRLFEDLDGKCWASCDIDFKQPSVHAGGMPGPHRECVPAERSDSAYDALLGELAKLQHEALRWQSSTFPGDRKAADRLAAALDEFRQILFRKSPAKGSSNATPPKTLEGEDGHALGYTRDMAEAASIVEKFALGNHAPKSPTPVRALTLDARYWVEESAVTNEGWYESHLLPLYTPDAFRDKFGPRVKLRLWPREPRNDDDRDGYYTAIRVRFLGEEWVIGPSTERRTLLFAPWPPVPPISNPKSAISNGAPGPANLPVPEKPANQSQTWYQWRDSLLKALASAGIKDVGDIYPTGDALSWYQEGLKPKAAAGRYIVEHPDCVFDSEAACSKGRGDAETGGRGEKAGPAEDLDDGKTDWASGLRTAPEPSERRGVTKHSSGRSFGQWFSTFRATYESTPFSHELPKPRRDDPRVHELFRLYPALRPSDAARRFVKEQSANVDRANTRREQSKKAGAGK
jgi:hypothetical protein